MTWITGGEAAAILSENSGRPISQSYVRVLASGGYIRARVNPHDASVKQYWKEDVAERSVRRRTARRVDERARDKRTGRPPGRPRKNQSEQGDGQEPLALVG